MFKRFIGLFLIMSALSGCNATSPKLIQNNIKPQPIRKDIVPEEIKEFAKNILDYGDYYMKESIENSKNSNQQVEYRSLQIGQKLVFEQLEQSTSLSQQLFPKLDNETLKVAKQCNSSLTNYVFEYTYLSSQAVISTSIFSENKDIRPAWDKVIKSREKMITDCQIG